MTDDEWVIVDTETNGVYPPICTVEIAAQRMVGWLPVGEPFRVLVNHDVPIDPGAQAVHGYSREFLRRNGTDPRQAHLAFHAYAGDLPLVAYNISFDWNRVLEPEYARLQVPTTGRRGFCAMTLARRTIVETPNYRLDTLKRHFQLGDERSHQALNDVFSVVRLFERVLQRRLAGMGLQDFAAVAAYSRKTPVRSCQDRIRDLLTSGAQA